MSEILIAALSPIGHVGPLLNVAQGLVDRGDRVTFFTSNKHDDKIRADGAKLHPLPLEADFDETRLDIDLPGRADTSGIKRVNFDVVRLFIAPMPFQAAELSKLFTQNSFDAVIADAGFFGILPFLLGDRAARPPILTYTTTPLMVSSRDTAPTGLGLPPSSTTLGRLRNRALNLLSQKVILRQSQQAANLALDRMNSRRLPMFLLDSGLLADRYIVPTVPEFDYPRSDLPAHVRYVGAVQRALSMGVPLVVAGNTEDKPEVAARVAWAGAGINLKTRTPTPGAVRAAVRKVLNDGRYLRRARDMEAAFARRDGVAEIAALVDEVIAERVAS